MNAHRLSHDRRRTFFAVAIIPKFLAAIAGLEQRSESRAKRRLDRIMCRRRRQTLRAMEELPWEVRKDVGNNRDF